MRFAALARALDPYAVDALAERLRLPVSVRDLALLAARHANTIQDAEEVDAESVLELLNAVDAWRRPERFGELLKAAGASGTAATRLRRAREAAAAVDAGAIAKASGKGQDIKARLNAARLDAMRTAVRS